MESIHRTVTCVDEGRDGPWDESTLHGRNLVGSLTLMLLEQAGFINHHYFNKCTALAFHMPQWNSFRDFMQFNFLISYLLFLIPKSCSSETPSVRLKVKMMRQLFTIICHLVIVARKQVKLASIYSPEADYPLRQLHCNRGQ